MLRSRDRNRLRLYACISSLSLIGKLSESVINPFFGFLDDMRFGPLLGLKRALRTRDENVTKGDMLVELNMRSYIPEARLRVKVSFYKNQMVAVPCGHAYPFVITSWRK
jgi:hypothetical protein